MSFCTFGRVLSEGSTAKVVEARIGTETIAVKCSPRALNMVGAESFYSAEVQSLRLVAGHPNVVSILFAASDAQYRYLGMDLVQGVIPTKGVGVGVAAGIVHALEHLFSAGIVHRDVAARNILVQHRNVPVLADFGFSCRRGRVADPSPPLRNVPPELQLRTDVPAHHAEDVYAFGHLLLELYPDSEQAAALANQLTCEKSERRLGFDGCFEAIKAHAFFDGFDWCDTALGRR